jgi:hypothetical protein
VSSLQAVTYRTAASEAGRRYADSRYGDPKALMERVRTLLTDP